MHQAHDSRHESPEGFCTVPDCDYRPYNEADLTAVRRRLNHIEEQNTKLLEMVGELHTIVMGLLDGAKNAQQSGGMAGVMARQMFPDLSQMGVPVGTPAPGQNGV
jgi:hypothetical protein